MSYESLNGKYYDSWSEKEKADEKWKIEQAKKLQDRQKEIDKELLEDRKKKEQELLQQEYAYKSKIQQEQDRQLAEQKRLEAERQAHDNEMRLSAYYREAGINMETFTPFNNYLFSEFGMNDDDNDAIRLITEEFNDLSAQLAAKKQVEQDRAAQSVNINNCKSEKKKYSFLYQLKTATRMFEWYNVVGFVLLLVAWGFISFDMIPFTDFIEEETGINPLYVYVVAAVFIFIALENVFLDNGFLRFLSGFGAVLYGLYSLLLVRLDYLFETRAGDVYRLDYDTLLSNNLLSPISEIAYTPFAGVLRIFGFTVFHDKFQFFELSHRLVVYLPPVIVAAGLLIGFLVNRRYRLGKIKEFDNSINTSESILSGYGNAAEKQAEIAELERQTEDRRQQFAKLKAKAIRAKWEDFYAFRQNHYNYKIETLLINLGIPDRVKQYGINRVDLKKAEATGSGDIEDYVSYFESKAG